MNIDQRHEVRLERFIPGAPDAVFAAWLDPKIPGTPFHEHDRLIIDVRVDGLWFWQVRGNPHYGRFTEVVRGARIQQTWMSRSTLGEETTLTVDFVREGEGTRMRLVHAGFTTAGMAKAHDQGWNFLLGNFFVVFGGGTVVKKV